MKDKNMEQTLILLKPDAVQRGLCGRIISRFEEKGLKLVALKFMSLSEALIDEHYAPHVDKPFFPSLKKYMGSGAVVALVLESPGVIAIARKLMGATFGCDAEPGTIRGDFGASKGYNLVHGSDSTEAAAEEIARFFGKDGVVSHTLDLEGRLYE